MAPTCSNDALVLLLFQAAFEGRKIATANLRAAYLHADMDNFMMIKLQGPTVDILCKMKPKNNCLFENYSDVSMCTPTIPHERSGEQRIWEQS